MHKRQLKLTQLKLVQLVKENKKRFYGNIWRNYGRIDLLLYHTEDAGLEQDLMPKYFWDTMANKHEARECKVVYLAIDDLLKAGRYPKLTWFDYCQNREEILQVCCRLREKYWKRFIKLYGKRARLRGGWPSNITSTQVLKELLAMGWVHRKDLGFEPLKSTKYLCKAHIGELWYPQEFDHHIDAIDMPFHIPGFSGTTIPKSK